MQMKAIALVLLIGCARAEPGGGGSHEIGDDAGGSGSGSDVPNQVMFTVTKMGTGVGSVTSTPAGIDCGMTCSAEFDANTMVTLTASPTTGTTFMGWSGACSGTTSCIATLAQMQSVTAMFSCDPGTAAFSNTGQIQAWTPPAVCVSLVTIDAYGAQGGAGTTGTGKPGGLGARIQGTVPVTPLGLKIIVGGQGQSQANGHGGGGGASYVYVDAADASPLIVAAGGGGASSNSGSGGCTPGPGSDTSTPTTSTSGAGNATGGANGTGGVGGALVTSFPGGGGGAGWSANGAIGGGPGGNGGSAPKNGGAGGTTTGGAPGGFGGGGSGISTSGACGGGGGYNGGGGGNGWNGSAWGCGGGGGSFNAGTTPMNSAGVRAGDGQVTLTW